MIRKHSIFALALLIVMGLAILPAIQGTGAQDSNETGQQVTTVAFDVAEDMSRFVYDKDVAHEDGMPAHGSTFITQGYLYPAGTLNGSNGVLADGSPEFPELVIGTWACRGWFVGDGAHAATGPMVLTTQHYVFGENLGTATFVSEGYELTDVGVPILRAATGGTGPFASIDGEVEITFLGFNASEGVNQRIVGELVGVDEDAAAYSLIPIAARTVSPAN
jgi:hypothetical protein